MDRRACGDATLLVNDIDFDGDEFVLVAVGGARNGSVSLDGWNVITFTPTEGFSGDASFTYTVRDSPYGFATQQVDVVVLVGQPADPWADPLF